MRTGGSGLPGVLAFARRMGRAAAAVLLPEAGCVVCGGPLPEETGWSLEVCPACLDDVFRPGGRMPRRLTSPSAAFLDGAVTGGLYAGAVEKAVLRLKSAPDRRLARFLARLAAEALAEAGRPHRWDAVVPVPLHRDRLAERGFNQALLLAEEMATFIGAPVAAGVCERARATPPQSSLPLRERVVNVAGAFRLASRGRGHGGIALDGARLLAVDDVLTTGATAGELARTLKAGGAREVWCAAVARAAWAGSPCPR